MRIRNLAAGLGIAAAIALVAPAATAFADVWDGGLQNCTPHQTGVSRAYSTGSTNHVAPGGGVATFTNGAIWKVTTKSSNVAGGGYWTVSTNGALDDPETYAYCINGTP
ncbi:MAG TPA: hypothetical protein VNR37_03630 [Microbacteriaceae bacterium]|nr:hypothetical protein [Microbacteriaceae bacterium]